MPETIKDDEQKNQKDSKSETEGLPQPFKFIGAILSNTLSKAPKSIQSIVAILFVLLFIIFALATLKGIAGVDFFSFLNPERKIYYNTISGDIVLKNNHDWSPVDYNIEFTSSKILYTRKEFMNLGYFKLTWIIRVLNTEFKNGEIDLLMTKKKQSGEDIFLAKSQKRYSTLYDPSQPYRWVHFVIDTTFKVDNIDVEFSN